MRLDDRFYKSTEVAEILGVSLRTLYRYMDSGKIDSVQLPSGRHRFTKKQIEEFLYSTGAGTLNSSGENNITVSAPAQSSTSVAPAPTPAPTPTPRPATPIYTAPTYEEETNTEEDDLEAELEALLESLGDEDVADEADDLEEAFEQPIEQPVTQSQTASSILEVEEAPQPIAQQLDENQVLNFYCPYNELRTIARIIKKTADDQNKQYAFTMNAGLSLFFPLDPFSIIHFYVHEDDLEFWKRNLQLKETSFDEANIGVLLSRGAAFNNMREVSGLKVVNKEVLIQNLNANGKTDLAQKASREL